MITADEALSLMHEQSSTVSNARQIEVLTELVDKEIRRAIGRNETSISVGISGIGNRHHVSLTFFDEPAVTEVCKLLLNRGFSLPIAANNGYGQAFFVSWSKK